MFLFGKDLPCPRFTRCFSPVSVISFRCGGVVAHCWIIVELAALEGRKKVKEEVKALITMEDIH